MIILHGENTIQSRQRLFELIEQAKKNARQIIRLEARSLDLLALEAALGNASLFGEQKLVIIEELHSLPKSKRQAELIEYVANFGKDSTPEEMTPIILWERRDLTATMLKKFTHSPQLQQQQFKLTSSLFRWLDSLQGKPTSFKTLLTLLRQVIDQDGEMMCLSMLGRQVRLLLQVQEGSVAGLPPFMIGKLKGQAASFTLPQLLRLHRKLLDLDIAQKTSSSRLGLAQELELLMTEL
jgi:DNA polymerase III delta subunit